MKLNWFSPVPPTPSAIAFHNAAVLPALAKEAEITVWAHELKPAAELEEHARVRHYDPEHVPWADINAADATIYHMGNNPEYHAPIWKVNRRHPGIVIIHDLGMQHFFGGLVHKNLGLSGDEYREMMSFYHPNGGAETADTFLNGYRTADEISQHCSLMGAALENATAVAAHTLTGYELVRSCSNLPAAYIPLFTLPGENIQAGETKPARERAKDEPYRIIIFGFLGPNRRLESVLQALNDFPLKSRFRLDVYGTLSNEARIQQMIDSLGLADIVRLHGFVPADELTVALSGSDLAINLRDPTMGEASASQLRIWQHGLPSLVSDTGWYATVSRSTVSVVRRRTEVEDIQMHLDRFLRSPGTYRQIGENGRRYVGAHHTVEAYVQGLIDLIETTLKAKGREAVSWMSGRAGAAVRPWFAEGVAGILLSNLAGTISDLFDTGSLSGRPRPDEPNVAGGPMRWSNKSL